MIHDEDNQASMNDKVDLLNKQRDTLRQGLKELKETTRSMYDQALDRKYEIYLDRFETGRYQGQADLARLLLSIHREMEDSLKQMEE